MSHPLDPSDPQQAARGPGMHHEIRRRGGIAGAEYEVGIRIRTLSEPESGPPGAPAPPALPGDDPEKGDPARAESLRFAGALHALLEELQPGAASSLELNRAAARIDRLGRQVHGVGWVRDHEIGVCLGAAVGELSLARGPGPEREGAVVRAILQLESALVHMDAGLRTHPAGDEQGSAG